MQCHRHLQSSRINSIPKKLYKLIVSLPELHIIRLGIHIYTVKSILIDYLENTINKIFPAVFIPERQRILNKTAIATTDRNKYLRTCSMCIVHDLLYFIRGPSTGTVCHFTKIPTILRVTKECNNDIIQFFIINVIYIRVTPPRKISDYTFG